MAAKTMSSIAFMGSTIFKDAVCFANVNDANSAVGIKIIAPIEIVTNESAMSTVQIVQKYK